MVWQYDQRINRWWNLHRIVGDVDAIPDSIPLLVWKPAKCCSSIQRSQTSEPTSRRRGSEKAGAVVPSCRWTTGTTRGRGQYLLGHMEPLWQMKIWSRVRFGQFLVSTSIQAIQLFPKFDPTPGPHLVKPGTMCNSVTSQHRTLTGLAAPVSEWTPSERRQMLWDAQDCGAHGFCKHFLGRSPYCVVVLSVLLGEVPWNFLKSVVAGICWWLCRAISSRNWLCWATLSSTLSIPTAKLVTVLTPEVYIYIYIRTYSKSIS